MNAYWLKLKKQLIDVHFKPVEYQYKSSHYCDIFLHCLRSMNFTISKLKNAH